MRTRPPGVLQATAAAATLLLLLGACTPTPPPAEDPLKNAPENIRLYGTDGNMTNSVAALVKDYPEAMIGLKGTAPLTRLSQSFRSRLRTVDPTLTDDLYAGESYDAVVVTALAAQIAHSTAPAAIAAQITGVTTRGTACETPKACFDLVAAGKDIAYTGISLRLGGLTDVGEPSASTYGILRFADKNTIDANQTEYVQAGDPTSSSTKKPPTPATGGSASHSRSAR